MKLKEYLPPLILKGLSLLPLSAARGFGRVVGSLIWRLGGRPKDVTKINLRLAYPELTQTEIDALAKRSLQEMATLLPEFAIVWNLAQKEDVLSSIRRIKNPELLAEDERGLVVLAPHLGNWEITGQFIAQQRQVSAMYSPPKQAGLESLVKNARERFGVKMYPANPKGVIGLSRDLKSGRAVIVLPDQVPEQKSGVYVPFFGVDALTMTLATGLANKTKSRIVLAAAFACEGGWELVLQEPEGGIYDADPMVAVAAMNRSIETLVAIDPAKYQWEYKRYKRQQDPSVNYY